MDVVHIPAVRGLAPRGMHSRNIGSDYIQGFHSLPELLAVLRRALQGVTDRNQVKLKFERAPCAGDFTDSLRTSRPKAFGMLIAQRVSETLTTGFRSAPRGHW